MSGDYIHLFVEYVSPLSQMLSEQTELDICSGLHSILLATDFLHSRVKIPFLKLDLSLTMLTSLGWNYSQ